MCGEQPLQLGFLYTLVQWVSKPAPERTPFYMASLKGLFMALAFTPLRGIWTVLAAVGLVMELPALFVVPPMALGPPPTLFEEP